MVVKVNIGQGMFGIQYVEKLEHRIKWKLPPCYKIQKGENGRSSEIKREANDFIIFIYCCQIKYFFTKKIKIIDTDVVEFLLVNT